MGRQYLLRLLTNTNIKLFKLKLKIGLRYINSTLKWKWVDGTDFSIDNATWNYETPYQNKACVDFHPVPRYFHNVDCSGARTFACSGI